MNINKTTTQTLFWSLFLLARHRSAKKCLQTKNDCFSLFVTKRERVCGLVEVWWVSVREIEREKEKEKECVYVSACERERKTVRVCVWERERVCVCMCARERKRESVCACVKGSEMDGFFFVMNMRYAFVWILTPDIGWLVYSQSDDVDARGSCPIRKGRS